MEEGKSHMWSDLAAAASDEDAPEFRDRLAIEMTPANISMAQQLGREWLDKHGE